jgi:hypothetical protein
VGELVDLAADDFSAAPWGYPGSSPAYSGLLHEGRYSRLQPKAGRRLGPAGVEPGYTLNYSLLMANAAAVDSRHLVVAVGSNAP